MIDKPKVKKSPEVSPIPKTSCDPLQKYYEEHEQDEGATFLNTKFNPQSFDQLMQQAFELIGHLTPAHTTDSCIALDTHQFLAVWEQ